MHPYRTSAERPKPPAGDAPPVGAEWAHGELTIAGMLIAVGGLGVALGAFGGAEGRELPLGLVLLLLGSKILLQEWRRGGRDG